MEIYAPVPGSLVKLDVGLGDSVSPGDRLFVLEVMKTEYVVNAEVSGYVCAIQVSEGEFVEQGATVLLLE